MKSVPEEAICKNSKKRKISDSEVGTANDKSKRFKNVNREDTSEKESDPEIGLEIMTKREWSRLRNNCLEMQGRNFENINPEKEELSEKDGGEEKSDRVSFTLEGSENIDNQIESSCRDSKNFQSRCFVAGRENIVLNHNASHKLPAKRGGGLEDVSREDFFDELQNSCQSNQSRSHLPYRLIGAMYQLDLSVLCSLRKFKFEHKYPSLSLEFGNSQVDKFNNIILRYKEKSIHIQVVNVEKRHIEDEIDYDRLFVIENRNFAINTYFNSFVRHLISEVENPSNTIEYLIIYTNVNLDLTKEMRLKQGRSKKCYPFKFDIVNCKSLKKFLFTNNNTEKQGFYQFSQDKGTREEFFKRLQFSPAMKKVITERQLPRKFENYVKEEFFDKLAFAVNQPKRIELNSIIKNEIKNRKFQYDYTKLREEVLYDLIAAEKHSKLGKSVSYITGVTYEFSLLMTFLHDMFLQKHMLSINFEGKRDGITNDITVNYRGRITCIKIHTSDSKVNYNQLFSLKISTFSLHKHFSLFNDELEKDVRYFIIYTNADLDLTEENKLKHGRSKDFYPLQFSSIDIQKKKYKILRNCSCINENGLYQFAQEETREKLLSMLKLPLSLKKEKKEGRLSDENEREIKEKFLNKLIFAVNQPNITELNGILRDRIKSDNESNNVPYNYEELDEIAVRWSESNEVGPITPRTIKELLEDIKNNRHSYQEIRNKNISEEIKFAKIVVGTQQTFTFDQFLDFLIKEDRIEMLKSKGVKLVNMSNILNKAGSKAEKTFKGLYNLWFDVDGNKTRCLKTLEEKGINLSCISSMLSGARSNAVQAFQDLYNLWFDEEGNKRQYLANLEEKGINLSRISGMLSGAGSYAAQAFKDLYNLWFDEKGNKTQYLKTLENEGVNLSNMSSVLSRSGTDAADAFKELYDTFFDEEGNKTKYLKTLEKKGINLANLSGILNKAGAKATKAFKDLYHLWFDADENKTQYLKVLEERGISLINMSSILHGSGANAAKAFKNLYNLWFDLNGNKTQYLITLEEKGIKLTNMSSILGGAGANAARAFISLYDLWFDAEENKTHYLKVLEKKGINLINMSSILHGAGANAAKAFSALYGLWFDAEGNETHYLKVLEEKGVNVTNLSSILNGAGASAVKAFKELCNTFFDAQGNNKQHLKHFIEEEDEEKCFTLRNLSGILSGSGANAKDAFEKLHNVCFDEEGERTSLLNHFHNAGFRAINLSSILLGAGVRASSILKKLHSVCFNGEGKRTEVLDDFYDVGFLAPDLCSILSAAAGSLKKFHDFCFVGETKKYFHHLLDEREGFTSRELSKIFHGAGANICSSLKDFHDVVFNQRGNRTQLLDDFYKAGFKSSDLSNVLSLAGNNAASIFKNFHKVCFHEDNYLNHFLAEEELFSPKKLSIMLRGVGINIGPIFKKLHDICFDKAGNKTDYLNNLIENDCHKIQNILFEKLRNY
ncbi:uncharacterized protein LOC117174148 [Belonocnema kinseyi]|uniref:uncharacterized protein LOC117174148 n=1 Tax=Belonocnema kinseyi TaxID=2817044 RepID=UPI00143D7CF5|nr:uncharacterized protein LOC117174148 [Belonocnema kinseyi]